MKKVDPNISKKELLRLLKEGRIYMDAKTYDKMKAREFIHEKQGGLKMKTKEQIKQEFKNATGKELPIYTYEGKLGVIYDWGSEFLSMEDFLKKDAIDFS